MKKLTYLCLCLFIGIGLATAQTKTVTGIVTAAEDGEPIIGATVMVKGTTLGNITNFDGEFTIDGVPESATTLVVSFVGMTTQEVRIAPNLRIALLPSAEILDEVIVVAYGTAKRSAFTGSASVVKSETIEKRQVSNITNALSGTVAGVQALSSTGQPGTNATIRIRGIGSMNASNNPLYVVDGISYEGDISAINSQDIESMTVLKDAAAAALYGARGANGVILVTTKKGKSGEPTVSLDARVGVNSRLIKNYDVLTRPETYMEKAYEALYNSYAITTGYSPERSRQLANQDLIGKPIGYQIYTVPSGQYLIGSNGKLNPNATLGYSDGQYFYTPDNWADETFSSNMRQEYNLSVTGGSDKISYYFSAGYVNDEGVIDESGFDRISTRMNVDYQLNKWLKIGANITYSNAESRYPGEQTETNSSANAFGIANGIAPIYPIFVRNADGSFMYDKNSGHHVYDYGDGSSTNNTRNYMQLANPKSMLLYDTEKYLMDILNGKWYGRIDFIEGLSLTASLGLHVDNTRLRSISNKYYGQSASSGGSVTQQSTRTYALSQQYLLNYNKEFGLHRIDALVGYETLDYNTENHYILGYNMYNDKNWTAGNVIDQKNGSGSYTEYATIGILSRLNYDYDDKYFGTLSFRRDASSRFHKDHRWGNFWSASAAWEMAKEDFMMDLDWINMLKVKASFGQQGNDALVTTYGGFYPYIDQYAVTGTDGVFSDGRLLHKGNKDLTWETSNAFNAGIDFALWRGKLGGTLEYFSRETEDMLYNKPVAQSNGYTSIPMNIGSMRNSGFEIELNYTPIERNNLKWTVNWNGTLLKNKILELHPDLKGEMISGTRIYKEGESMYQLYIVKSAGIDQETGLAQYWAKRTSEEDEVEGVAVGEEYKTSNWSLANNSNRQGTGDLLPTIYGGVGTTLDFYGFDFSIQCAYQLGGKVFDSGYQSFMHGGMQDQLGRNWHQDILNSWTETNRNTDVPRVNSNDQYASSTSDRFLISSDYFAINNITLGYSLPRKITNLLKIRSLRVYGAADNLALFTARKGLDPRMSYTSVTTSTYTALRSVSAGIKVTF